MGTKKMILFVVVFFHFCGPASLVPLSKSLPSVSVRPHENLGDEGIDEQSRTTNEDGNGVTDHGKFAHGGGGRAASGGRANGAGEQANGGSSTTPSTQGGTAVIPVYTAAAAANSHHNTHHGAASHSQGSIGLPTLVIAILASLTVHT